MHHIAIVIFPGNIRYFSLHRLTALYELAEGGDSFLLCLNQAGECLRAVFLPPVGRKSVYPATHCSLHQEYAIAHVMHFGTGDPGLLLHVILNMHRQGIWLFPRHLQSMDLIPAREKGDLKRMGEKSFAARRGRRWSTTALRSTGN